MLEEGKDSNLSEIQTLRKNKDHLLELLSLKKNEVEALAEKLQIKKPSQTQSIQTNWKEFLLDMNEGSISEDILTDEKNQNFEDLLAKYLFYSDDRARTNEGNVLERISMRKKETGEKNEIKMGLL